MSTNGKCILVMSIFFVVCVGIIAFDIKRNVPAANIERCDAVREQALIIAMARYVGIPIGAIDDDKAEGNLSTDLVEEIYARPNWLPLVAAREIKARCLAQPPR